MKFRNIYIASFILFCVLWLCMGTESRAEELSVRISMYEDGDVVGFIGDSITHVTYASAGYMEALCGYYLCRFPERNIEFRNLGAGGYKVRDVLNIYDSDPAFRGITKAVIMLGTNEAILGISAEEYIGNLEALVERLKADGLSGEDIFILTPPICDQNCAKNFDKNGNRRWKFEDRLIEYIEKLESKTAEWGVCYLDIHTPMVELTETLQKENAGNSFTTDCIHPNREGHFLIAALILKAQGAGEGSLSEIYVPEEGDIRTTGGTLTELYRGDRGVSWTWKSDVLPLAADDELRQLWQLIEEARAPFRETVSVEGLSKEKAYRVLLGEAELGSFTGEQLAAGIDLTATGLHPFRASVEQMESLDQKRHKEAVKYRNIWIEVMMQRSTLTAEQRQAEYEKWRTADEELRNEITAIARELAGRVFRVSVVQEGYSPEELEQDRARAEEQARREAEEQARKEAEEQARREAEEQARREAEEQARREAEEQARREAEEQARREAEEQARREAQEQAKRKTVRILGGALSGGAAVLLLLVLLRKGRRR